MEARAYLKKIKDDGWYLHDTDGSTRQYVHGERKGFLTVCVRHTEMLGPETRTAGLTPGELEFDGVPEVATEATGTGASGYCPGLPGVIATGEHEERVRERMEDAVALHLRALRGEPPEV